MCIIQFPYEGTDCTASISWHITTSVLKGCTENRGLFGLKLEFGDYNASIITESEWSVWNMNGPFPGLYPAPVMF